jgi:hypothetical protein
MLGAAIAATKNAKKNLAHRTVDLNVFPSYFGRVDVRAVAGSIEQIAGELPQYHKGPVLVPIQRLTGKFQSAFVVGGVGEAYLAFLLVRGRARGAAFTVSGTGVAPAVFMFAPVGISVVVTVCSSPVPV